MRIVNDIIKYSQGHEIIIEISYFQNYGCNSPQVVPISSVEAVWCWKYEIRRIPDKMLTSYFC